MVANIQVTVTKNILPQVRARFPREVSAIIGKTTHDVYARSQITVPVRKNQARVRGGALKQSGQVHFSAGSMEGEVAYTIYYAIYVHEGTFRMPARPFLTNALSDSIPGMLAAFASLERRLS